jgi:hypothetical protein
MAEAVAQSDKAREALISRENSGGIQWQWFNNR